MTAAALLLLVLGVLISPWVGFGPGPRVANREAVPVPIREPELVALRAPLSGSPGSTVARSPITARQAAGSMANGSDSLFDHSEDVEFILDPVTLHRGRATMTRRPAGVRGAQAVISF